MISWSIIFLRHEIRRAYSAHKCCAHNGRKYRQWARRMSGSLSEKGLEKQKALRVREIFTFFGTFFCWSNGRVKSLAEKKILACPNNAAESGAKE